MKVTKKDVLEALAGINPTLAAFWNHDHLSKFVDELNRVLAAPNQVSEPKFHVDQIVYSKFHESYVRILSVHWNVGLKTHWYKFYVHPTHNCSALETRLREI